MGMYDEIRCEYPLPGTGYRVLPGHAFQTKDLECLLDRYTITAEGLLVLHREVWEPVPEEERPYYGTLAWEKPLGKWIRSMKAVPVGDEEIPHHGDIRFYDAFRMKGEDERRVWLEYRARFTEGSLSRIEVEDVQRPASHEDGRTWRGILRGLRIETGLRHNRSRGIDRRGAG